MGFIERVFTVTADGFRLLKEENPVIGRNTTGTATAWPANRGGAVGIGGPGNGVLYDVNFYAAQPLIAPARGVQTDTYFYGVP